MPQPSAEACLRRLREGNDRFVRGEHHRTLLGWNPGIVDGQQPFAVVLGCSDSRAPAELVFDQGLGDLFVIRVAGNVIAPSGIGSVEFAVSQFDTPLVVVMGHTRCGAIAATVQALEQGETPASKNLRSITDRIAPHIQGLVRLGRAHGTDRGLLLREAMQANVLASMSQLQHGSSLLEQYVSAGRLRVVGAVYELETGRVEFLGEPG
ncbi:MAG: carbonic anhydrase [Deltaproteobacteria bacterium]